MYINLLAGSDIMELKGMRFRNVISEVKENSIADELRIEPGDRLIAVNGVRVQDIIEYDFLTADDYLEIEIHHRNGERVIYEIDKEFDEDLGIVFESPIMDSVRSCNNKCIFCFVDQLPKGMRKTLYFKDDDSRLSFLQGNFVTLTNMSMNDIKRLVEFRISPINVSVHVTDPDIRCKMLGNRFAGDVLDKMKFLAESKIDMNVQIVLVPEFNDGEVLIKTLDDLSMLYPYVNSVAIVPVGLTKFREGLADIRKFDKKEAETVIELVEAYQGNMLLKHDTSFVFASDEFYIMAEKELPNADSYEGFIQLENGVGLIRRLELELNEALDKVKPAKIEKSLHIACGVSVYNYMCQFAKKLEDHFEKLKLTVHKIENEFFGTSITVTGLLTGTDIVGNLKDVDLEDGLMLVRSMFKADELIMLDDFSVEDLEEKLDTRVMVVEPTGMALVDLICSL